MTALKSARILAASLGVLAFGALAASPAMAFDKVDWSWKKVVEEKVYIDAKIHLDVLTTGMVEVEKLQIYLGDVEAKSEVKNIDVDHWCDFSDLAEVISAATAIANLQVITSDVPVYLHDAQFLADVEEDRCDIWCNEVDGTNYGSGNLHTDIALLFSYLAINGNLEKADVKAYSEVEYIDNATVDSSATAIGNLISVDLQSDLDGGCDSGCAGKLSNHIVIADITQFAYADIKATSYVGDVKIDDGYTGSFATPLVNSVATAIGNAVIINVGKIEPPAP